MKNKKTTTNNKSTAENNRRIYQQRVLQTATDKIEKSLRVQASTETDSTIKMIFQSTLSSKRILDRDFYLCIMSAGLHRAQCANGMIIVSSTIQCIPANMRIYVTYVCVALSTHLLKFTDRPVEYWREYYQLLSYVQNRVHVPDSLTILHSSWRFRICSLYWMEMRRIWKFKTHNILESAEWLRVALWFSLLP